MHGTGRGCNPVHKGCQSQILRKGLHLWGDAQKAGFDLVCLFPTAQQDCVFFHPNSSIPNRI